MYNSINKISEFLEKPHVQIFLHILRIVSATTFIITLFGLCFFAVGYSFLYGYYLSGEEANLVSTLNMIINPTPFNYYSIVIISALLMISVVFLLSSIAVYKKKKLHLSLGVTILLLFFHVCLSVFFTDGQEIPNRALSFSIIWAVPIFIIIMVFWMIRAPSRIGTSISGSLYGFILPMLCFLLFNYHEVYAQLLLPLTTFLAGIIATYSKKEWYKKYFFRYLIFLPYTFIVCAAIVFILQDWLDIPIPRIYRVLFSSSSLVINVVVSFRKVTINESDNSDNKTTGNFESTIKSLAEAGKASLITTITIVIVALGILTPHFAVIGGQYIGDYLLSKVTRSLL